MSRAQRNMQVHLIEVTQFLFNLCVLMARVERVKLTN